MRARRTITRTPPYLNLFGLRRPPLGEPLEDHPFPPTGSYCGDSTLEAAEDHPARLDDVPGAALQHRSASYSGITPKQGRRRMHKGIRGGVSAIAQLTLRVWRGVSARALPGTWVPCPEAGGNPCRNDGYEYTERWQVPRSGTLLDFLPSPPSGRGCHWLPRPGLRQLPCRPLFLTPIDVIHCRRDSDHRP